MTRTILRHSLPTLTLFMVVASFFFSPHIAHALPSLPGAPVSLPAANPAGGLQKIRQTAGFSAASEQPGAVPRLVGNVINVFLGILGTIFVVLMVYGGYKWMMAQGEEEEVTKAKDVIRQAIIGLMIILGAYAITAWVVRGLVSATQYTPMDFVPPGTRFVP